MQSLGSANDMADYKLAFSGNYSAVPYGNVMNGAPLNKDVRPKVTKDAIHLEFIDSITTLCGYINVHFRSKTQYDSFVPP